jgi:hypothetical protein
MSSKPVQVRHCRHHQPKVRAGPIIEEGEKPFAMLQDLWIKHREWVFEPISERNHDLWHRRLQFEPTLAGPQTRTQWLCQPIFGSGETPRSRFDNSAKRVRAASLAAKPVAVSRPCGGISPVMLGLPCINLA